VNKTNLSSYLYGVIVGGLIVGGTVGGFFTQWNGDIASTACGIGGILGMLGLIIHAFYDLID